MSGPGRPQRFLDIDVNAGFDRKVRFSVVVLRKSISPLRSRSMGHHRDVLDDRSATSLFRLCVGIYFIGGFTNALVGLLVPRLRLLLGLSHTHALMVQLAFHSSYLLFALPITAILVRAGYMRGIAAGLSLMAASGLALAVATSTLHYAGVLLALLVLASGVTFLQIAGNIVVPVVEPMARAVPRMTMLQGFNSLGTVLAPLVGARFLLQSASTSTSSLWAALPFVGTATATAVLAIAFISRRNLLRSIGRPRRASAARLSDILSNRRLLAGSAAIFCYVGAEVTIGTLLVEYLTLPTVLALSPVEAGQLVSLYWAGAMIGRFVGARLLVGRSPARLLLAAAAAATLLVLVSVAATGPVGAIALLAVGLCNATMYPVIFALSLPDDMSTAPYASMVLCMAVVGGAIVPFATGVAADAFGLTPSLLLPASCYVVIILFAWLRQRTMPLHVGNPA
ncbi:MFS transporter [Sphingomonas endolithica]|uniref:MFS transporter n=1 Tax=Sphingomonas endolithica TaxID=2972485 RepID=UPI0021B0299C|nr:MFS transporter [Sphingomonas sp. ZFBP2030]